MKFPEFRFSKIALRRLFSIIFYSFFIIFILLYIRDIDFDIILEIHFSFWFMFSSLFFGIFFRYWGALIWIVMLKGLGAKISRYRQLLYIYGKSWMGRYIPGKITWILGKVQFASEQGIEKEKLALSAALEGGIQIFITLLLSLIVLSLDARFGIVEVNIVYLLIFISILLVTFLTPWGFNYIARIVFGLMKKRNLTTTLDSWTVLKSALLYAIGFIISGISYFLFVKSIYAPLASGDYLFVIGIFSLAGVVGILAFFAPNGIGVREGIQLLLMSAIMSKEEALVISIVARIWSLISDLLFFGFTFFIYKIDSKPKVEKRF